MVDTLIVLARIQGFATRSSYAVGEKVLFKVKTRSRGLL